MDRLHEFWAGEAYCVLDLDVGHIRALELPGAPARPLHEAPWLHEPELDSAGLPVEARLAGDFLCAPFSTCDVEEGPLHGWTANSAWTPTDASESTNEATARFRLDRTVMGAEVEKELTLVADAPLLYQTHRFRGGSGSIPVAHHVMTRMLQGGRFSCSPKRFAFTPQDAPEAGRSLLAYPAQSSDLAHFPAAGGGTADLGQYPPAATGTEDFVALVEQDLDSIGWSAVVCEFERRIVFTVKDCRILPLTMLWLSNGGRDYSPWNGRHIGVLGIEDGCAYAAAGHAASIAPNELSAQGIPTSVQLAPNAVVAVRMVVGAISLPAGWLAVERIALAGDLLVLSGNGDGEVSMPFREGFFAGA